MQHGVGAYYQSTRGRYNALNSVKLSSCDDILRPELHLVTGCLYV
jgi:hypothetical protein